MGIRSWFTSESTEERQGYDPVQLTAEDIDHVTETYDREAVLARPDRDNGGIPAMEEVLESLHSVDSHSPRFSGSTENVSPAFAFEIRYGNSVGRTSDDRTLALQYLTTADGADGLLERQLQHRYPESQIERRETDFLTVSEGQYVAGSTLGLRKYSLFPIQNTQLDGWRSDPTGGIMTEMAADSRDGDAECDVVVQIMFKPASRDWLHGVQDGHGVGRDLENDRIVVDPPNTPGVRDLSKQLTDPVVNRNVIFPWHWIMPWEWEYYEDPPSRKDKAIAKMLEELDGKAWHVTARIFAVSDDPDVAVSRASKTANMFRNFYEYRGDQTFIPQPLAGGDLRDELRAAAGREWRDSGIIKPQVEVAGLVNIPEAQYVSTNKMQWSLSKPGDGVPPGTPRADWDALGVDASTATKEQLQVALIDREDSGVTWYGLGGRFGVEAGVDYDNITNPHKLVHGESGTGKTTFLAVDTAQQFRRGGSGLRLDPTGDDTDELLAEWPDDRDPEDLIYMDLSGEYDRIPRFNFLEIPGHLEPGTREHTEFLEALAEDILAMVGEAGGTDNYVGGLMKRVVKTVVRAMGRRDVDATLFDVAVVCCSQENLSAFAAEMPEDRLEYLRGRVRSLAEREDSELDPLAGRLDEWVLNENVRELICARNPTFSVDEAVGKGKEIIVRFSDAGSSTVKHMVGNALITRSYFAQRRHRPDHPFELVVDEAQSVITAASDIEDIMDQGRKFDYRVTVACQRPATQLNDDVRAAILGNARTIVSFASGREEEARAVVGQHEGIDVEDLVHISPYKFYVSTETADRESTYSYQVEAFRAPTEARAMAADAAGESPETTTEEIAEKVTRLKDTSLSTYGARREELDTTSPFAAGGTGSAGDRVPAGDDERTAAYQAIHDACLVRESESVPFDELEFRLRWYLDAEDTPQSHLDDLLDRLLTRRATQTKSDGEIRYGVTDDAIEEIYRIGQGASDGREEHRRLFREAYRTFTRHGGRVQLLATADGDGGRTPDFRLELPPDFDADAYPELAAVAGNNPEPGDVIEGECECSTGRTQPAQTVRNLAAAASADRPCLFVVGDGGVRGFGDDARKVAATVSDPPCVKRERGGRTDYYMDGPLVPTGEGRLWRPRTGAQNAWWRDHATGEIVYGDTDGAEFLRVSVETLQEGITDADIGGTDCRIAPKDRVNTDAWQEARRPATPDVLGFDPDETEWAIVVVPDDDRDRDVELYAGGTCVPLGVVGEGGGEPPEEDPEAEIDYLDW